MANKKTKNKSQGSSQAAASKPETKKSANKPAPAKKNAKAKNKDKNKKPGFFARIKKYFASVRSEMKRVVWPTKSELLNYTITVCVSLIVVGVVIALLDAGIGQALVLFSGLRG